MNQTCKYAIVFLAGATISGGITYILTKKHYEKILEEEISEMRDWVYDEENRPIINPVDEEDDEAEMEEKKTYQQIKKPYDTIPQKPELSSLVPKASYKDNYPDGEPEELEDDYLSELEAREESVEPDDKTLDWEEEETQYAEKEDKYKDVSDFDPDPYLISRMDFMEEQEYDKDQLTYYANDNTLVDSDDDIIHDIDGTVGFNNLETMAEEDLVYIRNDELHMCYEVEIVNASYIEDVLGVKPTAEKPRKKKSKKSTEEDEA